jgi:serine-type D-Ala-D-Ala carboxypeptidase/endopeptidase (penicillin-binding protein 4)
MAIGRILLLFFAFTHIKVDAQYEAINDIIYNWVNDQDFISAQVGISFHDITQGTMIAGQNQYKSLIPASSLKILPSLLLIKNLGPDYKYATILAYDGTISDSILNGNIYIIGSGDPTLASKKFENKPNLSQLVSYISYKVKNLGIKHINGDIITDQSIFDSSPICPTWEWGDLGRGYACGAWGLNVNENEFDIWLDGTQGNGGSTSIKKINPEIPNLDLINEVYVDDENNDERAFIFGGPYTYSKKLMGTIPFRKSYYKLEGAIPDPPKLLADLVYRSLQDQNIACIKSAVRKYNYNTNVTSFDTIFSNSLKDIVTIGNHQSINLYSESFLKLLGLKISGTGSGSQGIEAIKNYYRQRGINIDGMNIEDGSGLSSRNSISPFQLSSFLSSYANEQGIESIKPYLPMVGKEGTVSRLLTKSPATGRIWMKSGTLNRVVSYTGIMQSKSNKWFSFSIIINNHHVKNNVVRLKISNLLENAYKIL